MIRCKKCILPKTYPEISFDAEGICNFCHSYNKMKYLGRKKLESILQPRRRNDGKPDCLVAVSGGRYSSYMLYRLKKSFGMHPLAFNYDNGFVSKQARINLHPLTDSLVVPLISISSQNHIQNRMFKTFLQFNARKSPAHALNQLCVGCRNGIWGALIKSPLNAGSISSCSVNPKWRAWFSGGSWPTSSSPDAWKK